MPIYEYACGKCGHVFDVLQKISDAPPESCPSCGSAGLRKLVSAPSFHLKGTGWYQTDFRKGSSNGSPLPDGAGGSGGEEGGKGPARSGHTLDGPAGGHDHGKGHSHGDGAGQSHSHSHSHGPGHSHSHGPGGHSHSHGPGGHKHEH